MLNQLLPEFQTNTIKLKSTMQQINNLSKILFIMSVIFLCVSCDDTKTNKDEKTALVEKENELLKKENELLKKEKELNSTTTPKTETEIQKNKDLATNNQTVDNLDNLKKMNGKYPYEAKLLSNPALTKRLKSLLKGRYRFLKETWAVETPIEINNNIFVASGCQQHNCGNTNFIIVFDFSKDILYAGIREEQVVKIYSEDGSNNEEIIKWSNDN
jgi:hypothetical protein